MYFQHAPTIWSDFPALVAGMLYVEGIQANSAVPPDLTPLFDRARARLSGCTEAELPEVQAWRRAFSQMGVSPTRYRSAAEALLRRFRKEHTLPTLHPLVDRCNAVSLAYALPIAVIDLDQVADFLEVRYAVGDETYLAFSGEVEYPEPGEVIFVDAHGHVHARRWTFRQSRRSTVSETTRRALIVGEGLHATASTDVALLLDTLVQELQAIASLPMPARILSADAPRWELV